MNKKVQKVTSLTLASSIMLASCSPNGTSTLNTISAEDQAEMTASQKQKLLKSCVISMSKEDIQLAEVCSKLASDLLKDEMMAKEFAKSPAAFMQKQGYAYTGELDRKFVQMVSAFADDDIRKAMQEKDFERFASLCREKNLVTLPQETLDTINILTAKRIAKRGMSGDLQQPKTSDTIEDFSCVAAALAIAIVVAIAFVVIIGPDGDTNHGNNNYTDAIAPTVAGDVDLGAYGVFTLNKECASDVPYNAYIEEQCFLADQLLKETDPVYVSNVKYQDVVKRTVQGTILNSIME